MHLFNPFIALIALAAAPLASAELSAVENFIAYGQQVHAQAQKSGLETRQSLANLPTCAQPAIEKGITSTSCSLTDYTCICHSTGFISGVDASIQTACSASDQAATTAFANQVCTSAGAPLSPADSGASTPATSAAPAASAPAASAPVSSAPVPSASSAVVPTATPPYPVAGNATGSANCTNSTTPFLGAASGQLHTSLASVISLVFGGVFVVLVL